MQWTVYHNKVDSAAVADSEMCRNFYAAITGHQSGILKDLKEESDPLKGAKRAMGTLFKDQKEALDKVQKMVDAGTGMGQADKNAGRKEEL